jgi:hypothetical protein
MALSPEELAQVVAALRAADVTVPADPADAPVHPAVENVTPVQSLLGQLRLDPTNDTMAKVENWLVESGYEQAPPTSGPAAVPTVTTYSGGSDDSFTGRPSRPGSTADDVIANLLRK